jgi:hypothetical protein
MRLAWSVVPVFLTLGAGCASTPDPALVAPGGWGAYWQLSYWEHPIRVEVPALPGGTTQAVDAYVVEAYGLSKRGWGTWMPWSWFSPAVVTYYFVDWRGPSGNGGRVYASHEPVSEMLSRPDLAMSRGEAFGSFFLDGADETRLREVRESLLARRAAGKRDEK